MDDFALAIDNIQKIVFSHTLEKCRLEKRKIGNPKS